MSVMPREWKSLNRGRGRFADWLGCSFSVNTSHPAKHTLDRTLVKDLIDLKLFLIGRCMRWYVAKFGKTFWSVCLIYCYESSALN